MKVSDVIHGRVTIVDLRRVEGNRFPAGLTLNSEVFLHCDDFGEFQLRIDKEIWAVEGTAPRDRAALRRIDIHNLPRWSGWCKRLKSQCPRKTSLSKFTSFPLPSSGTSQWTLASMIGLWMTFANG